MNVNMLSKIVALLPRDSVLLNLNGYMDRYPFKAVDLDGDGIKEIVLGYKKNSIPYLMILKGNSHRIKILGKIKGNGCGITNIDFIKDETLNKYNISVCWKIHRKLYLKKLYRYNGESFDVLSRNPIRLINEIWGYPATLSEVDGVKTGYINEEGEFMIRPKYDWGEEFQDNGLAVITLDNLTGVINLMGDYIITPEYENIGPYLDGRAIAYKDESFYMLDEVGRVIFKTDGFLDSLSGNRAVFGRNNEENIVKYGYIDSRGNVIIPPKYNSANPFNDNRAIVELKKESFALIDRNGKVLSKYNYPYVGSISEGLIPYKIRIDGKFGFINEDGEEIIPPKYSGVELFKDGRAVVLISDENNLKYGFIDKKGDYVYKPEYDNIITLGEKRVALGRAKDADKPYLGYKYAIGDYDGKLLTDFSYSFVNQYDRGYASVSDGNRSYFVDTYGNIVNTLPVIMGEGILSFVKNLIKLQMDNRIAYLDKRGNLIWKEAKGVKLNSKYSIKEKKYKPKNDYIVYYPVIEGFDDIGTENRVNEKLKNLSIDAGIEDIEFDYSYNGDFSVDFYKKNLVIINLTGYIFPYGAAHGMPSMTYVHVDLSSGKFYDLRDLFKGDSDYLEVLSDIVGDMIKSDDMYWSDDYSGIREDQPFYVDDKNLYLYFYPYEIAPYAAGFPTFKIPFKDIINIVDKDGEFWRSFNY